MNNSYISLSEVAKAIDFRLVRVQDKVQKMQLPVHSLDGVETLTQEQVKYLLLSYVHSAKTSEETKSLAAKYLERLESITPIVVDEILELKDYQTLHNIAIGLKRCLSLGIRLLGSRYFAFTALLVAVGVQMHHSTILFYRVAEPKSWIAAIAYAVMLDFFIIVVALSSKHEVAKVFGWLTFISNLLYFSVWIGFDRSVQACTNVIITTVISGIVAFIIYSYTDLLVGLNQRN